MPRAPQKASADKPSKDKWKAGDVVRLKSGGPSMTVIGVIGRTLVSVMWFPMSDYGLRDKTRGQTLALRQDFPEEALEEVKD